MNRSSAFKYKVMGITAIALVIVAVSGIFLYVQLRSIIRNATDDSYPDEYLFTYKRLASDLDEAGNHARSYMLTEDSIYSYSFRQSAKQAKREFDQLRELNNAMPFIQNMDTLQKLVDRRLALLDNLMHARDIYRVQEALDKVADKVDKVANGSNVADHDEAEPEKEQRSFLRRLFSDKREKEKIRKEMEDTRLSFVEVGDEIKQVREEERDIEITIKQEEARLLEEDKKLNEQILSIFQGMENNERDRLSKRESMINKAARKTNTYVIVFSISVCVILLFMTYIVINYIRYNMKVRKTLQKAGQEAKDMAAAKELFLANMSHEIRTPMNAIAGFTEQLAQSELDATQRDQINTIQRSIEHLLYLLNDVLDYSKLEAGAVELEHIPFRLDELIHEVFAFFEKPITEKGLYLNSEIDFRKDKVLFGDPFRLKQVLLNLISNAVKFTNKGGITLRAGVAERSADHIRMRFEVVDTGHGMTPDEVKNIFQEFRQANATISRNYGGTGLGLSIVKKLLELKQGTINIRSKQGEGTTVSLEIPFRLGDEKDLALLRKEQQINAPEAIPPRLKILIVDDEVYNRKLLSTILHKYAAQCTEAENGREAITLTDQHRFDVILMDIRMPQLNGMEATRVIRSSAIKENANVPIIALTAAIGEKDKQQYRVIGMNGFLPKPLNESQLLSEINRVLSIPTGGQPAAAPTSEKGKETLISFTELQTLSAGDDAFYIDMLQTFISGTKTGFEDMKNALNKKQYVRVADYAHKMCSPCRHLNTTVLYTALKEIETMGRNEQTGPLADKIAQAEEAFVLVLSEVEKELDRMKK